MEEQLRVHLRDKRCLELSCDLLERSRMGTAAQLFQRILSRPEWAVQLLLIARFGLFKSAAAVRDAALLNLPPHRQRALELHRGQLPHLLTLLSLFQHDPRSLAQVRCLDVWHRRGAASLILADKVLLPEQPIEDFLVPESVTAHLSDAFPRLRVETLLPRSRGHLLFLRRPLRQTWHWREDREEVDHGHAEELIILHFLDGGREVRLSASTGLLSRQVADHLASAFFGQPCRYIDDHRPTSDSAIQNLLSGLLSGAPLGLKMVELVVDNAPLGGLPRLSITQMDSESIAPAVAELEARFGGLLTRVDDIRRIKVCYQGSRINLSFPQVGGQRVVHFGDARLDHDRAAAFQDFMLREFGLQVRSSENQRT